MKKTKLLKSLLVAAGLLVGANAWADFDFTQVASFDFEGESPTNPFTDNSGISGRCNATIYDDETTSSKALKFEGSNLSGKTYGYHVYDFSTLTSSSSAVKVAFDFKMANQNHTHFTIRDASVASETNKSSYTGTGAIFRFGNSRVSSSNRFGYNGNAVSGASYDTWYHIEVIVDIVNKEVSYTLKDITQTTTIDTKSNLEFLNSTAVACTQLDFFGISNANMASIDNIVVSEYTSSSATNYSVEKYDKSGTLISTTSGLAGVAGETSTATDADKATFYSADTNSKYVYDENDERNVTSLELTSTEATNVLKLYFNTYTKCTATIQSVCGDNSIEDITETFYSDETPTLYWPKVISCPDGYYIVDAEASSPSYGHTFSSSELTKTVTYTLDENIVYYAEYENILTDKNSFEYFSSQSSKGTSRCIQKSGVMKTAMGLTSAGVYDVSFACGNRDSGHSASLELKLIDSDNNISTDNVISAYFNGGEWKGELTAVSVAIPAGSELYLTNDNGTGNAKIAGDYILVRKVNNTYTASFHNDANWENVYAYVWTTEEASTKRLGAWPGTKLEGTDGVYNLTCYGNDAPAKIIFNNGNSGDGNQTSDFAFEDGAAYNSQGKLNSYTATFTTNLGWEPVCAYAWSGDGGSATPFLGAWPGKAITATNGKFTLTFLANNAPEKIIFNNGKQPNEEGAAQTSDLAFEDGKTYKWNAYTVTFNNTGNWSDVYAYTYNPETEGGWPGKLIKPNGGIYSYTYTGENPPLNIIFNNNSGIQTGNLVFEDGAVYNAGGVATVMKTITAAGYATFCSANALDFSSTGLTAYIAKKDASNNVTFTPVRKVPANTGVLLKGDAGNYTISTTSDATDDVTDNVLRGVTADKTVAIGSFVLMNGTKGIGFYKTTKQFTVGANTAYIEALPEGTRSFIGFNFGGETTAIEGVAAMQNNDGKVYNLQGQRVSAAKKGLYIVNGKKMVIK